MGQAVPVLQSTYYSQLLSSGLNASLNHVRGGTGNSQSQSGTDGDGQSPVGRGDGPLANELAVNEYGPCDGFDFRHGAHNKITNLSNIRE